MNKRTLAQYNLRNIFNLCMTNVYLFEVSKTNKGYHNWQPKYSGNIKLHPRGVMKGANALTFKLNCVNLANVLTADLSSKWKYCRDDPSVHLYK